MVQFKVISVCEYNFEIRGNQVKVLDTSLNEYVGDFVSDDVLTSEKCESWLNEFYGWEN